jgi:hypothetical protein
MTALKARKEYPEAEDSKIHLEKDLASSTTLFSQARD